MPALAVKGCKLEVMPPGTGQVTITSDPSDEILVGDNGIFFKEIQFKVENSNGGGTVLNNDGKGTGSIIATGSNILSGEDKVVLQNDKSASVVINGTSPSSSGSTPSAGAVVVMVTQAGQTDVEVPAAMRLAALSLPESEPEAEIEADNN